MHFNDLNVDTLTHIARKMNERQRDAFMQVTRACHVAVQAARELDIIDDVARPERTLKEKLPLPKQLLRPGGGYDLVYRNVLNNLAHLNPQEARGPLWKFYENCASFYDRYPRKQPDVGAASDSLPVFEGFSKRDGKHYGFGRWTRGATTVLGTLHGNNLHGLCLTLNTPTSSSFCMIDMGIRAGYGLVIRKNGATWEGQHKQNELHGLGKTVSRTGMVQSGTFAAGEIQD